MSLLTRDPIAWHLRLGPVRFRYVHLTGGLWDLATPCFRFSCRLEVPVRRYLLAGAVVLPYVLAATYAALLVAELLR